MVGQHQVAVDDAAAHVDTDFVACVAALAGCDCSVDKADASLAKGKHGSFGGHALGKAFADDAKLAQVGARSVGRKTRKHASRRRVGVENELAFHERHAVRGLDLDFVVKSTFAASIVGKDLQHVALCFARFYCEAHGAFCHVVHQTKSTVKVVVGQARCVLADQVGSKSHQVLDPAMDFVGCSHVRRAHRCRPRIDKQRSQPCHVGHERRTVLGRQANCPQKLGQTVLVQAPS